MYHNTDDNEMYKASRETLRKEVSKQIAKNKDGKIKSIGDIVLIWDTSRLRDLETNQTNTDILDHNILAKYPSIVIEDGLKFNADIVLSEDRVYPCNLDLIVWNKTLNKKFRTCSEFVKITDKGV